MAEGIVEELARRLLSSGKDIARDIRGMGEAKAASKATTPRQLNRYSPENVEATRRSGFVTDSGRPVGDFADSFFNNLPFLIERDAEGYTVDTKAPGNTAGIFMSDRFETEGLGSANRLEMLAGEMLALAQRAAEGKASPEELELLETYQEFMTSRTGM
jgi:hypothetical protein